MIILLLFILVVAIVLIVIFCRGLLLWDGHFTLRWWNIVRSCVEVSVILVFTQTKYIGNLFLCSVRYDGQPRYIFIGNLILLWLINPLSLLDNVFSWLKLCQLTQFIQPNSLVDYLSIREVCRLFHCVNDHFEFVYEALDKNC